ncbi:MAG TPA: class I SAM-dependent methyltransferase [Ktedonobacterales bacterium]|jgi:SAM-dependent methyltransferase|nr:class I SAM-dependent methyltransferase [Ktedonobacterales bacterium]
MAIPKPAHLGPAYAAQFQDAAVVAAYPTRPPYPAAVFDLLTSLVVGPRVALDAGCGTGDVARRLAPRIERMDAVDISAAMVAAGQRLPGGDAANLRWQVAALEDAPLAGPYGLVVAGESLHWMDWERVLPRLHAALAPGAMLAIVERAEEPSPWSAALLRLIVRYSTNHDFRPYDLVAELARRDLFTLAGATRVEPEPFTQRLAAYVESIHSRNGFSRDRMRPEDAAAFDAAATNLIAPHAPSGQVTLHIGAELRWGSPRAQAQ